MSMKLVKYLILTMFFLAALSIFAPKKNLYFLLEESMQKENMILSKESINEKLFSLEVNDSILYYKNIKFANIKNIDFNSFIFYNNIYLRSIEISNNFILYLPKNINFIDINVNLLTETKISSSGDFGEVEASFDFFNRSFVLYLKASSLMKKKYKSTLKHMKLEKKGYKYEYRF